MKKQLLFIASLFVSLLISQNVFSTNYTVNSVGNTGFSPAALTVNVGDTVTFINTGGFHNVNASQSVYPNNPVGFGNAVSNNLWSYEWVFTVPGTYDYQCDPHVGLGMVGVVIVIPSNNNTIYDIVSNSTDHTTLKAAIDACALDGTLSGAGPFTLFAPTDAAFNLLPSGTVTALLADIPQLTDILKHHVVGDAVLSTMLSNNLVVPTLNGDVTVTISGSSVFIESGNGTIAQVTGADIIADNGVVHVIDAVLLPAPPNSIYDIVTNSPDHTTLKAAIDACSLDGTLSGTGPFTLFAPTDAAFNLLPAGTVTALLADIPQLTDILLHHVVGDDVMSGALSNGLMVTTLNGGVIVTINSMNEVFIDNAQVIIADIPADNGVVHVINAVLLPTTTSVSELNNLDKEYLYSINILGEKINRNLKNQVIFNVFTDGAVERVFNK